MQSRDSEDRLVNDAALARVDAALDALRCLQPTRDLGARARRAAELRKPPLLPELLDGLGWAAVIVVALVLWQRAAAPLL